MEPIAPTGHLCCGSRSAQSGACPEFRHTSPALYQRIVRPAPASDEAPTFPRIPRGPAAIILGAKKGDVLHPLETLISCERALMRPGRAGGMRQQGVAVSGKLTELTLRRSCSSHKTAP